MPVRRLDVTDVLSIVVALAAVAASLALPRLLFLAVPTWAFLWLVHTQRTSHQRGGNAARAPLAPSR